MLQEKYFQVASIVIHEKALSILRILILRHTFPFFATLIVTEDLSAQQNLDKLCSEGN